MLCIPLLHFSLMQRCCRANAVTLSMLFRTRCIVPWVTWYFILKLQGKRNEINGIPYWCPQYQALKDNITDIIFAKEIGAIYEDSAMVKFSSFESGDGNYIFAMVVAIVFWGINVCWLCMMWSAASLGTPTQPERRDKYLRPLIIFQLISGQSSMCLSEADNFVKFAI